jgi:hypothetical protein
MKNHFQFHYSIKEISKIILNSIVFLDRYHYSIDIIVANYGGIVIVCKHSNIL